MRKETAVQVQSEIETVESEIRKMEYHLVGVIVDNTAKLSVFRTEASDVIERRDTHCTGRYSASGDGSFCGSGRAI